MTIITTASTTLTGQTPAVTTYLAGPLDQVNTWVSQWGTALQVLGIAILGICMVLVGIKLGTKAVVSSGGANTGNREAVGAIFTLLVAGILVGAALIIVPIFVSVGTNSGTTPAPAQPAATDGG